MREEDADIAALLGEHHVTENGRDRRALVEGVIGDLRAGVLAVPAIAAANGVTVAFVTKYANMLGLRGDVRAEVRSQATAMLVNETVADASTERAAITRNAALVAEVVRSQSARVVQTREIVQRLLNDLQSVVEGKADMLMAVDAAFPAEDNAKMNAMFKAAIALPEFINHAKELTGTLKTLIDLERKVFNIGEEEPPGKKGGGSTLEEYILTINGSARRVDNE